MLGCVAVHPVAPVEQGHRAGRQHDGHLADVHDHAAAGVHPHGDVVGVARAQMAPSAVNRVGACGGVTHHQPVEAIGLVVEPEPPLVGARGGIDERASHLAPGLELQALGYLAAPEADAGNRLAAAVRHAAPRRRCARLALKILGTART